MQNKLISIAMCTYNGEKFIKEQLDSILDQTYKNIEIIIVDDVSNDTTVEIIQNYKDNRIKFFKNEKNLGFVKNFEKAISLCSGDYIALADQDDIWKNYKIEKFIQEIGDNLLIYSDAILIDKDSKEIGKELIRPVTNLISGSNTKAFLFYNCISGNTMMFSKELIKHIIPINKKFSFHDSWIAFIANSLGKVTYTEEAMIYYRRYDEQVTRTRTKNYNSVLDKLRQKKDIKMLLAKNRMDDYIALKELPFLDKSIYSILDLLIQHYKDYDKGIYNYTLYKVLLNDKDSYFAIKAENKRKAYSRKLSMKFKSSLFF